MMARLESRSTFRSTRGFTLLELLVVIAIILILIGIGVEIGPGVLTRGGEEQVTKMSLANAQQLLDEYTNLTGQSLPAGSTTASFVILIRNIGSLNKRLATLPPDVFNGANFIDGWGNALYLNPTGTANSALPSSSGPYFASAGADAAWGNVTSAVGTTAYIQAQDNLYSFSVK